MSFKFTEIDGIDTEMAEKLDADESIGNALSAYTSAQIEEGTTNRVDLAKEEFKKKMNSMDSKLKAAQEHAANAPDIDPEELKALREARDKSPELQATLDAMKKRSQESEQALKTQGDEWAAKYEAQSQVILEMQLGSTINAAINEHDSAFPDHSVKTDLKDVVSMLAKEALRFDDDSQSFRVYTKSGDIVATDKGAATPVDWLNILRKDRPNLFNAPAGSGATGSKHTNGSAKKYVEMSEAERVALYKEDPAQFTQLKASANGDRSTI